MLVDIASHGWYTLVGSARPQDADAGQCTHQIRPKECDLTMLTKIDRGN